MTRHLSGVALPDGLCCDSAVAVSLRRVLAGSAGIQHPDPEAAVRQRLDELFKEHSPYVARLAYRMMGRDVEIDDVVQDVFVLLLRHIGQIRHADAVRAWLATTTVRLTRRRLRMKRLGLLLGLGDDIDPAEIRDSSCSPEDRAAFRAVHAALAGLGANVRIAWILRYFEQERIEDVARLCGCSKRTAKRWIARAQGAVKGALGHE